MNKTLTLYCLKVRDQATGKWIQTRHRATLEEAHQRYGKGNYQVIEWSKEVRELNDPGRGLPGRAN